MRTDPKKTPAEETPPTTTPDISIAQPLPPEDDHDRGLSPDDFRGPFSPPPED